MCEKASSLIGPIQRVIKLVAVVRMTVGFKNSLERTETGIYEVIVGVFDFEVLLAVETNRPLKLGDYENEFKLILKQLCVIEREAEVLE